MRERLRHCKRCGIGVAVIVDGRFTRKLYCLACSDIVRIDNQRRYQRNKSRINKRDAAVAEQRKA